MNLVFIIKNRDETPFMVVRTTPNGSTFEPMSDSAKDIAKMLRQEYGKTPITKPELVQTMDASKIIEGPSPSGTATQKKVANISIVGKELQTLPVLSISEVLLSEFSNEEFKNVLTFKASSFISDQTRSSAHFEIKGVRAIWDPSLSIPGTNRRGGFRCPVGTRYGGQITDRFGRSCGWGVARRIANQIADIGERLEQRDDDKRKRRLDRRNARMIRRLGGVAETGRVEGGLRNIARRLDGGSDGAPRPVNAQREANRQQAIEDLRNLGNQARDIILPRRRRQNSEQEDIESRAPSARVPRNRRRDVTPETAPTPKPRPARQPAPAGRRPQPRPRVAPQAENVDVLTARDASDAGETEDFKPYVLRKYNEYANRVREIRAGGGNAGMLTRREWYAINKENLRDAWKDAHGRSAPQDFEPPTPQARRPRNNRGRRRQATAQGAGRAATRRPTPNDVPEPAPARPVRPARPARRPRRSPDGRGFVTPGDGRDPIPPAPANQQSDSEETTNRVIPLAGMFDLGDIDEIAYVERFDDIDPNVPSQGVNGRGQIRWNPDIVKAFDKAEEKIRELNLQNTHMPVYLANAVFVVRKADAKAVEEAFLSARQGNLFGYRDVNADAFPDTNIGETPKTPPAPQGQRKPSLDEKAAERVNGRVSSRLKKSKASRFNKNHGHIEIDGILVPEGVKKGNRGIATKDDAIQFVRDGGDLDDVPDVFVKDAILGNASYPDDPAGGIPKRFKLKKDPGNGINNRGARNRENKTYLVTDNVSGKKYILKSPSYVQNEFVGEQYAAIIGQALGRPMSRVRLAGDITNSQNVRGNTKRNAPILVEHYGDVVEGAVVSGMRPPAQKNEVSQGYVRVLDQIIGNPDRHGKNYLWAGDEQIPIDHGIINNGLGEPAILTADQAKRILRGSGLRQEALTEMRQKISELTEQQIDRIADQLAQSFAVLEGATPADKVKIDNTVVAVRRNLKALRRAAEDIAAGRP
jgi:hypothetical protein